MAIQEQHAGHSAILGGKVGGVGGQRLLARLQCPDGQ